MEQNGYDIKLKVWGEYACFTRPEFKVERVSYPVITPSAARGILEAVYWKPEFCYRVREIHIINQGTHTTIMRNELSHRQDTIPLVIEGHKQRQQRTSLILKDVAYIIFADIVPRSHAPNPKKAYREQFERKAKHGQYFQRPYLGCREFVADFALPGPEDKADPNISMTVGTMVCDLAYVKSTGGKLQFLKPRQKDGKQEVVDGHRVVVTFSAMVEKGILTIPADCYQEIQALEGKNDTCLN
jgi:CRISPR-associated protein Cas5d